MLLGDDKMNIGVFDSGIGGLTVLDELLKQIPDYNFIFYGDTKNNPYGEKSDEQLLQYTSEIVEYLKERDCGIIVIACNTATTRCRNRLMEKYPDIPFIGTVPAVKVATDNDYHNILVMGTPATIYSPRLSEIIHDNRKEDQNIYLLACPENHEEERIERLLDEYLADYRDKNIDAIVLGCTHYPYVGKQILERIPSATLLDGADGVARETLHQIKLKGAVPEQGERKVEIYFSKAGEKENDNC